MNVIITGASSFIGLPLTKKLSDAGHTVYAVMRPDSANRSKLEQFKDKVKIIECSLSDIERLQDKIGDIKIQIWFHLGWDGVGSVGRADVGIQKKNILSTLNAIKTAKKMGCKRFIFAGSQAEYGIKQDRIIENAECDPVIEYGKAKLVVEQEGSALCRELDMEYVHTRIFSVYGPGDHKWSLVNSCVRTFLNGEQMNLSPCMQKWNFMYIEDAAEALVRMMSADLREEKQTIVNIAGSDTRTLREFVEEIYEICGKTGSYLYGERKEEAGKPVSLDPDITKLQLLTGWTPKYPFKAGIEQVIQFIKTEQGE